MKGADRLALALTRNARHAGSRAQFDQALRLLTPEGDYDAEIRNAVIYEECLWDLAAGDLVSLLARLDSWMPAHGETLWSLRKAGLLSEMQDHARACALLEATLVQIRRARRRDVDDLVSLSLEGWALYLALAYSGRGLRLVPVLPRDMPEPFERWRALGIVDCDAFSEYQVLKRLLEANEPRPPETTRTRGFDLDHASMTLHFVGGPSPTVVAAYQMVMLAEITGIPPVTNHMKLFDDGLKAAAKALSADEPWLASQLAIRLETSDNSLEDVFSRTHIARLPEPLVATLRDALLKRVAFGLASIDSAGNRGRAIVGSALEILSRVAVRLRPEELRGLFEEAVSYYRSPMFRRMSVFLGTSLAHLLARILESLPHTDIVDLLPSLLALPLPQEVGSTNAENRWQDPVSVLPEWFDGTMDEPKPRSAAWEGIVSHLLIAAKAANVVDRGAAVYRLFMLLRWQILDEDEKKAFAVAVWSPEHQNAAGIPQHTNLRPWVLLILPEERSGQAKEALLHYIAELSRQRNGESFDRLATIGELLRHFVDLKIPFELSEDVQAALATMIGDWAAHRTQPRHRVERHFSGSDHQESETLDGVASILPYIATNDDLLEKIWDKADAMDHGRDGHVHAFRLYSILARHWPERTAELVSRLRRALVSDQEAEVWPAIHGLFAWINLQETSFQPTDAGLEDLVREVGIGIAARRMVLLRPALDFAQWVFRKGPERLRQLIARDCDYGLTALLEEASYARSEQPFDVPAIRAACFRLASAMAAAGFESLNSVAGWLAEAKDDPLPEVRNAEVRRLGHEAS